MDYRDMSSIKIKLKIPKKKQSKEQFKNIQFQKYRSISCKEICQNDADISKNPIFKPIKPYKGN